jgi:hypothetical protein
MASLNPDLPSRSFVADLTQVLGVTHARAPLSFHSFSTARHAGADERFGLDLPERIRIRVPERAVRPT